MQKAHLIICTLSGAYEPRCKKECLIAGFLTKYKPFTVYTYIYFFVGEEAFCIMVELCVHQPKHHIWLSLLHSHLRLKGEVEMCSRHYLHTFCTKVPQNYGSQHAQAHIICMNMTSFFFRIGNACTRTNNFENEEGSCAKRYSLQDTSAYYMTATKLHFLHEIAVSVPLIPA